MIRNYFYQFWFDKVKAEILLKIRKLRKDFILINIRVGSEQLSVIAWVKKSTLIVGELFQKLKPLFALPLRTAFKNNLPENKFKYGISKTLNVNILVASEQLASLMTVGQFNKRIRIERISLSVNLQFRVLSDSHHSYFSSRSEAIK